LITRLRARGGRTCKKIKSVHGKKHAQNERANIHIAVRNGLGGRRASQRGRRGGQVGGIGIGAGAGIARDGERAHELHGRLLDNA
jgi:hypothetical protein